MRRKNQIPEYYAPSPKKSIRIIYGQSSNEKSSNLLENREGKLKDL